MENKTRFTEDELLHITSHVVQSYLEHNTIAPADVPTLISAVYKAFSALLEDKAEVSPVKEPAVPIKKSVTPDYIICLEDGKKLKMLKRHLREHYDMTPDQYREKWGLPPDYPMVASNYARARSEFDKRIGLGKGGRRKPALKVA